MRTGQAAFGNALLDLTNRWSQNLHRINRVDAAGLTLAEHATPQSKATHICAIHAPPMRHPNRSSDKARALDLDDSNQAEIGARFDDFAFHRLPDRPGAKAQRTLVHGDTKAVLTAGAA
jgi:aminoglycoside phosphotransferase (APT) family kinase protein